MRVAWATDLHLNFADSLAIDQFADEVHAGRPDVLLLAGDIGQATDLVARLGLLRRLLQPPIYFVLGNHDYYHGSIAGVRGDVAAAVGRLRDLTWLSVSEPVSLTGTTALVGHDGWGDGRLGNTETSPVVLNDFRLIEELRQASRSGHHQLITRLQRLGDEAASHLRTCLTRALAAHQHVLVLTHVPPFREAAWHEGRESGEDWLPYFACQAVGDVVREVMADHPDHRVTVLCGHTHGGGYCRVLPNVEVFTGGAEYGQPRLQGVFEVD